MSTPHRQAASPNDKRQTIADQQVLDGINRALHGLRFSSIEVVVHEGKNHLTH